MTIAIIICLFISFILYIFYRKIYFSAYPLFEFEYICVKQQFTDIEKFIIKEKTTKGWKYWREIVTEDFYASKKRIVYVSKKENASLFALETAEYYIDNRKKAFGKWIEIDK